MNAAIVTGSHGFIGSALVKELERRGVTVYGIDMSGWDREPPKKLPDAAFFHLAWVGKAGPKRADWRIQLANVKMALEYYEQACAFGCSRFICAGTIGEKMLSLPECQALKSQNAIYVNTKLYLHHVLDRVATPNCRVIWATLGNMYGVGISGGSILDYALQTILKGGEAIFGPGEQPYDFVNVADAIRGLAGIGLGDQVKSCEFYVGYGKPRLLKDWLFETGEIAGRKDLIKIGGRPDDGTRFLSEWFSIDTLTRETGYVPQILFADGIKENISFLRGACYE